MRIALAADHRGFEVKEEVKKILDDLGHSYHDVGSDTAASPSDYPDFGFPAAEEVATGESDRAILVCSTGAGMSMVANKVRGVRAALATSSDMAKLSREHNDANVLILAARYTPASDMREIIRTWLETEFEGGRHVPRIDKISSYEGKK